MQSLPCLKHSIGRYLQLLGMHCPAAGHATPCQGCYLSLPIVLPLRSHQPLLIQAPDDQAYQRLNHEHTRACLTMTGMEPLLVFQSVLLIQQRA